MSDATAIKVERVSKTFKLPHEKTTSIKGAVVNFGRKPKSYDKQKALKDISFEIKKGEFFGIIGRNGSGKSTLLKLLAGIYSPSEGIIHINGKLTPFIELGVGFNPELTGRENVYLNGALLGFNHKDMEIMYEDIVKFAELEQFMDQKLKNYSSGMQVRLAFSIAIRANSDILLIDEVLAVGDATFQEKCFEVFRSLKKAGKTIVFVSHDLGSVKEFCTRAIVINKGDLVFKGTAKAATDYYLTRITKENQKGLLTRTQLGSRMKSLAQIKNGKVLNEEKQRIEAVGSEGFSIAYDVTFTEKVINPNPGVIITNHHGLQVCSANASWAGLKTGEFKKGEKVTAVFSFPNFLETGYYRVTANVLAENGEDIYGWETNLLSFDCMKEFKTGSIINADYKLAINRLA